MPGCNGSRDRVNYIVQPFQIESILFHLPIWWDDLRRSAVAHARRLR